MGSLTCDCAQAALHLDEHRRRTQPNFEALKSGDHRRVQIARLMHRRLLQLRVGEAAQRRECENAGREVGAIEKNGARQRGKGAQAVEHGESRRELGARLAKRVAQSRDDALQRRDGKWDRVDIVVIVVVVVAARRRVVREIVACRLGAKCQADACNRRRRLFACSRF